MVEKVELGYFGKASIFYYISAVIFFLITWEINDWLIKKHVSKQELNSLSWLEGLRILLMTLALVLPIFALTYFVAIFGLREQLGIDCDEGPLQQFVTDLVRATMIAVTVLLFNLFYYADKVKKQVHNKMLSLEKELMASKYKSLKSQISPHFLFNSLNTLTALMYEDRDLASDFTTRLASCYRYILDNKDNNLVKLDKELAFLDSFIFMMNVRHKMSLKISIHLNLDTSKYMIPTLCLQMLVENALKHNYYSKEKPLLITISNDSKNIIVENTHRKRKDIISSTQLGINNIKKRYQYYTNREVEITQNESTFCVKIPLLDASIAKESPLSIVS